MCHVPCVMCHVPCVMCHVSYVICHTQALRWECKGGGESYSVPYRIEQIRSAEDERYQASVVHRSHNSVVGQNRIYTSYMTVYLVISLPKIPYTHRIHMVLANPTQQTCVSKKSDSKQKVGTYYECHFWCRTAQYGCHFWCRVTHMNAISGAALHTARQPNSLAEGPLCKSNINIYLVPHHTAVASGRCTDV